MRTLVFLALVLSACIRPQSDWKVTAGSDFHIENLAQVKKGVSTAGEVVQALGVPFVTRESHFVFAVRKHRDILRDYFVYASPATQELTAEAKIWFIEGVCAGIDVKKYEKLYPAERR